MLRAILSVLLLSAAPAPADDGAIRVSDAYARASMPGAPSGAAFLVIENAGETDDRLIGVASPVAERVELHTHVHGSDGVVRMMPVEGGIEIPAGGRHALERGGDHVMFMGIAQPFADGAIVPLTLIFEIAGEVKIGVPVDPDR